MGAPVDPESDLVETVPLALLVTFAIVRMQGQAPFWPHACVVQSAVVTNVVKEQVLGGGGFVKELETIGLVWFLVFLGGRCLSSTCAPFLSMPYQIPFHLWLFLQTVGRDRRLKQGTAS